MINKKISSRSHPATDRAHMALSLYTIPLTYSKYNQNKKGDSGSVLWRPRELPRRSLKENIEKINKKTFSHHLCVYTQRERVAKYCKNELCSSISTQCTLIIHMCGMEWRLIWKKRMNFQTRGFFFKMGRQSVLKYNIPEDTKKRL